MLATLSASRPNDFLHFTNARRSLPLADKRASCFTNPPVFEQPLSYFPRCALNFADVWGFTSRGVRIYKPLAVTLGKLCLTLTLTLAPKALALALMRFCGCFSDCVDVFFFNRFYKFSAEDTINHFVSSSHIQQ